MRLMRARMMNMGAPGQGNRSPRPPRRRQGGGFPGMAPSLQPGQARPQQGPTGQRPSAPFGPPRPWGPQGAPRTLPQPDGQGSDSALPIGQQPDPGAFKALFKQAIADPEVRQSFLQELSQLNAGRHPGGGGGSSSSVLLATALETLAAHEPTEVSSTEPSWMEEALEGVFGESLPIEQALPAHADQFGPLTQVSANLRVQAAEGYRAGVIPLKPGMFLVTEVPAAALQPEFGIAAVLAPLAISMATKALEDPDTQKALLNATTKTVQATGKGLKAVGHGFKNVFHRDGHRSRRHTPARHPKRPQTQPSPARQRPPAQLQRLPAQRHPVSRPIPMRQPYEMKPSQAVVPQGYYAPTFPMGYPAPGPMQMWQPAGGYFPMQGGQMPMNFAQPTAVPWADSEELAGVLEAEVWPYYNE